LVKSNERKSSQMRAEKAWQSLINLSIDTLPLTNLLAKFTKKLINVPVLGSLKLQYQCLCECCIFFSYISQNEIRCSSEESLTRTFRDLAKKKRNNCTHRRLLTQPNLKNKNQRRKKTEILKEWITQAWLSNSQLFNCLSRAYIEAAGILKTWTGETF
jgi:hypothetical protein